TTSASRWPASIQAERPARVTTRSHPERKPHEMADFSAEVYQNEFLPAGGTDAHAIVTVTCTGAGTAGQTGGGGAAEIVLVDTSGAVGESNIGAVKQAAVAAIDQVIDGTWFAVIAGNHEARLAFPADCSELTMALMD